MSDDKPPIIREIRTPKTEALADLVVLLETLTARARAGDITGIAMAVRSKNGFDAIVCGETNYLEAIGMLELAKFQVERRSRAG